MPTLAPRACQCGKVVAAGATCICQRQRKADCDTRRPSARARGYDSKWDRERTAYLKVHNRCAFCSAPATVVDHKIPHRGDKSLFWDRSNWQPLCGPCHNSVKQRQEQNKGRGRSISSPVLTRTGAGATRRV